MWKPLPRPIKLQEDDGQYFRDPNAARYPSHPMQPAIEAVLMEDPNFPTTSIDIVACGSTLGNLLRFVRCVEGKFRFIVEVVGSTVFFVRRENSPTEVIPGVRGYGHTFPEAYTVWPEETKGSVSHQRILRYDFAGLDCLVRFQSDGYLPDLIPKESKESTNVESPKELDDGFSKSTKGLEQDKKLLLKHGGKRIPQAAVFDLKTRTIRKKDHDVLGAQLPRMWLAQIPNFILAFHNWGVFEEIHVKDVREDVITWEREQESTLRQLAGLLRMIVAFARGQPDGRMELYREEAGDKLELREVCEDVGRTLPVDLEDRWVLGISDRHDDRNSEPDGEKDELDEEDRSPLVFEEDDEIDWESGSEKDYTACSASDCGYCGHCRY